MKEKMDTASLPIRDAIVTKFASGFPRQWKKWAKDVCKENGSSPDSKDALVYVSSDNKGDNCNNQCVPMSKFSLPSKFSV